MEFILCCQSFLSFTECMLAIEQFSSFFNFATSVQIWKNVFAKISSRESSLEVVNVCVTH